MFYTRERSFQGLEGDGLGHSGDRQKPAWPNVSCVKTSGVEAMAGLAEEFGLDPRATGMKRKESVV